MSENEHRDTFEAISKEGMIARTARMLSADDKITASVYENVVKRFREYCKKHEIPQHIAAGQMGFSHTTLSQVINKTYQAKRDKHIRAINNWIELDSRRRNIIQNREFVDTAVAREIIAVAEVTSETCTIGVVYGPARIGKTFTLKSIEGSDALGNPIYLRVGKDHRTLHAFSRMICRCLEVGASGTLDAMTQRIVKKLEGTRRMLMIDEADKCTYDMLEYVRDLHDTTECPVLFAGKPVIYEKFGFRELGDFKEVTDQLAGRVVMRRDLTERTRQRDPDGGSKTQRIFSRDDILKLIQIARVDIPFRKSAIDWLHERACTLGNGGLSKTKALIYLACKAAISDGASEITAKLLASAEKTTIGGEAQSKLKSDSVVSQAIRKLV